MPMQMQRRGMTVTSRIMDVTIATCVFMCVCAAGVLAQSAAGRVPVFEVEPQSTTVVMGGTLELVCLLEPKTADVGWTRNGQAVIGDGGLAARGGVLRVTNMTPALAGNYECVASTPYGSIVSSAARVQIAEMGRFSGDSATVIVNVTEGNTALVPCSPPPSIPAAAVTFELNGVPIDTSSGRQLVLPSGNLHIGSVRASDRGTYRCIATNTALNSRVTSASLVQLNVLVPVTRAASRMLARSAEKMTVLRGDTLILECLSQGSPVPVVTWDKYGSYLPERRVEFKLGNLYIRQVEPHDEGTYICRSTNDMNQANTALTVVEVLEKPVVQLAIKYQTAGEGSTLTLRCSVARGKPQVRLHWLHNGVKVTADDQRAGIAINEGTLTLAAVRPDQAGLYQCVGNNSVGVHHAVARVDVTPRGAAAATPAGRKDAAGTGTAPKSLLTLSPSNSSITEGDRLTLPCEIAAASLSRGVAVRWLLDGRPLTGVMEDNDLYGLCATDVDVPYHYVASRRGSLCLASARQQDGGQYVCVAFSSDGTADHAVAHVSVAGRRVTPPPSASSTPVVVTTAGGNKRRSTSPPLIHDADDRRGGGGAKKNPDGQKQRGNLPQMGTGYQQRPSPPEEEENEEMFAEGDEEEEDFEDGETAGWHVAPPRQGAEKRTKDASRTRASSGVGGRLIPPSQPQVAVVTDSAVQVSWTVPDNDGMAIAFFRVQYRDLARGGGKWKTIETDIPARLRKFDVTDLQPGSYKFRIMAVYANHDNRHSENSVKVTLGGGTVGGSGPGRGLKPPLVSLVVVKVHAQDSTTLTVEWQCHPNPGQATVIDGFMVQFKPTADKSLDYRIERVPGADNIVYAITDLEPGSEYSVRVLAFNEAGLSQPSNSVVHRLPPSDGRSVLPGGQGGQPPRLYPSSKGMTESPYYPEEDGAEEEEEVGLLDQQARPHRPASTGNDKLYMVLGIVLGSLILILVICSVICCVRQRHHAKRQASRTSRQKFEDPARSIHRDTFQQQQVFLLNGLGGPQGGGGGSASNGGTLRQWAAPPTGHLGATDDDDVFMNGGGGASADSGIHMSLLNPMDPSAGPTVMYRPPSRQSEKVTMREPGIAARPVSRGSMMSFGDTRSLDRSHLKNRTRSQASQDDLDARRTPFPTIPESQPLSYGDAGSFYPTGSMHQQAIYENSRLIRPLPYANPYASGVEGEAPPSYPSYIAAGSTMERNSRLVYMQPNGDVPTFPRSTASHRSLRVDPPTLPRQMPAGYTQVAMTGDGEVPPAYRRSSSQQGPASHSLPYTRSMSQQNPPAPPYTAARHTAGTPTQQLQNYDGEAVVVTPTGQHGAWLPAGRSSRAAFVPTSAGLRQGAMSPLGVSLQQQMPGYTGSLSRHAGHQPVSSLSRGIHMGALAYPPAQVQGLPLQQQLLLQNGSGGIGASSGAGSRVPKSASYSLDKSYHQQQQQGQGQGQMDYIPRVHDKPYSARTSQHQPPSSSALQQQQSLLHPHEEEDLHHQQLPGLTPCQCNGSPDVMKDMATSTDLSGSDESLSQMPDDDVIEPSPLAEYLKTSAYFTPQSKLAFSAANPMAAAAGGRRQNSANQNYSLLNEPNAVDGQNRQGVPNVIDNVL